MSRTTLVCPECQYGFETEMASDYTCQNCGHTWRATSMTLAFALTIEGRKSCPELHVRGGEGVGKVYPLEALRSKIGRTTDCEIYLTNLAVSRVHAEIVRMGDECIVRDLGSRSGTFVNGAKVSMHKLKMHDEIVIAGNVFEYLVRYEAESLSAPGMPSMVAPGTTVPITQKGRTVTTIRLEGEKVSVGRHADRDAMIDHPLVSGSHAVIMRQGAQWTIFDTKSATGTFVNGKGVIRAGLVKGDRVQFGPVAFLFDGEALEFLPAFESVSIQSEALTVRRGNLTILNNVTMTLPAGELIGLIGPSGAGKSTLLNALSGCSQASAGHVMYNGIDLYANYEAQKDKIGYVPQDDIIHVELTPRQAFTYAARLRLPKDTSAAEIRQLVGETLLTLGLDERADIRISRLSGGQRKRVSLGVELLTRCKVLFLDEPTSGLDPATEARMMQLFRRLSDQGRTIVVTTHVMENIDLLDKVAVMYRGRLVFYGPPDRAMKFFKTERATLLYDKLEEASPEEWEARFKATEDYRKYSGDARNGGDAPPAATPAAPRKGHRFAPIHQMAVLASRYWAINMGDLKNVALMMAQPLIIYFLICITFSKAWQVLFLSALAIFWVGCTNAAREIVKERSVYLRERMVNLAVTPYVLSKIPFLALLCLVQSVIAVAFVKLFAGIPGNTLLYMLAFFAANLSGMALGLAISSIVARPDHSQAVVPIALIPQIIFAGMIEEIVDMNVLSRGISVGVSTRWTYESLKQVFWERGMDIYWRDTAVVAGFFVVFVLATIVTLRVKD